MCGSWSAFCFFFHIFLIDCYDVPYSKEGENRLQWAICKYSATTGSIELFTVFATYKVLKSTLQRAYLRWKECYHKTAVLGVVNISIVKESVGWQAKSTKGKEKQIISAELKYSSNDTASYWWSSVTERIFGQKAFSISGRSTSSTTAEPTKSFRNFLEQSPDVTLSPVHLLEAIKVSNRTTERVCEHISRVDAAIKHFNI